MIKDPERALRGGAGDLEHCPRHVSNMDNLQRSPHLVHGGMDA